MTITSEDFVMLMSFVERIADWFAAVFGAEYAGIAMVFFVAFVAIAIWWIFGGMRRRRRGRRGGRRVSRQGRDWQ